MLNKRRLTILPAVDDCRTAPEIGRTGDLPPLLSPAGLRLSRVGGRPNLAAAAILEDDP